MRIKNSSPPKQASLFSTIYQDIFSTSKESSQKIVVYLIGLTLNEIFNLESWEVLSPIENSSERISIFMKIFYGVSCSWTCLGFNNNNGI